MELRHLRYFVAVAEELHFGHAATRLHIAQPPLSRQIQALEGELGFALFERSRHGVEMTAAGTVFLEHVRRVTEALDLGVREARRASVGESGSLAVGYLSSLAYSGLTELLRAYRQRFPNVEVALREGPPTVQLEALKAGRLDVGFVRGPIVDDELVTECVRREPLVIALPDDHPLARRKKLHLSALADEPFVLFPRARGPAFFDLLMGLCRAAGFTPRIVQEAPQADVLSLVAAGFGVSLLPEAVREQSRHGLALRPIVGSPRADLLVTWRRGIVPPALREFLEVVRRVGVRATPKRRASIAK